MSPQELEALRAYARELTRDWPPPESPEQVRVIRRVFGPHLMTKEKVA